GSLLPQGPERLLRERLLRHERAQRGRRLPHPRPSRRDGGDPAHDVDLQRHEPLPLGPRRQSTALLRRGGGGPPLRPHTPTPSPPPMPNDTSISMSILTNDLLTPNLIDGAKNDLLALNQLSAQTSGSANYIAVSRKLQFGFFTQADGSTTPLDGAMEDVPL